MQKIISKVELASLIKRWMNDYDVVAPVKDEKISRFRKINGPEEIWYNFLTEVTAKTHLMPEGEKLLSYKDGKPIEEPGKIKPTILFGARKCDLNAIQILDKVMYDPNYLNKRKNTILVGLFCDKPDKFCFCNSMQLEDYYDLFLYPKGKNYVIDVATKKGEGIVEHLKEIEKEIKIPNPKNFKKLNTHNIEEHYRDSMWDKDVKNCLSCGACTVYCPTCNCFDIRHKQSLDGKSGENTRHHSSCMTPAHTEIAGGQLFRETRLARFKHFVYHKVSYFKKKTGRPMCVGCGRCLRVCPTKIDWVKTINTMKTKV